MKKMILIALLFTISQISFAQITTIWEKSSAKNTFPKGFMGTGSTERGFGTGKITLNPFQKLMERSGVSKNYPSYLGTGSSYYPNTPSLGCLCAFEKWSSVDGSCQLSYQQMLIDKLNSIGFKKGFLVLLEIDGEDSSITQNELEILLGSALKN